MSEVLLIPSRVSPPIPPKRMECFSSGGGTQSACIVALIIQGRLPRPDYICIADTERERSEVWQYHDAVIVPALEKIGLEIHRIKKSDFATEDLWAGGGKRGTLLPAFTTHSGKPGKLQTHCSDKWKKRVVNRFLRSRGVPSHQQRIWIGFSLDEAKRYIRLYYSKEAIRGLIRFPLIEDVPLTRSQAIAEVLKMGWPMPPRSACWMCPNQGDAEWRDLKSNHPKEFRKAIALERQVQKKEPNVFLHPSCIPLDKVDFNKGKSAEHCQSGLCFV